MIDPFQDGITHINIYSKGLTPLGRMLSNFYKCEIRTKDGMFMSVEAYYYWLGIDCDEEEKRHLRYLSGYKAKEVGQKLKQIYSGIIDLEFEDKMIRATWDKVKKNLNLFNAAYKGLPFEHYYNYNGGIVDVKNKCPWLIDAITRMCKYVYDEKDKVIKI